MQILRRLALTAGLTIVATTAQAAPYDWVDWTSYTATTEVEGTLPGGNGVNFTGEWSGVITGAGPDYWAAIASAVTSAEVDNGPPASDIIGLSGGPSSGTQTITFDSAVVDPVMAIFSLGQAAVTATFDFEDDFDILNDGSSVAGSSGLTELAGYVLEGAEGHGLIRFNGTFTSISWTVPTYEYWAGFQIGVAVPAPASLPLFALALAALAVGRRRISA